MSKDNEKIIEIPEEDRIDVTVNRNAIVEVLAMLNISTYNLQVFENTPAYKPDLFALQYMIKNNALIGEYILNTFSIEMEEIIARVKKEIDDGKIKSVGTDAPNYNHGVEYQ
jgi:hypothetical protein